MKDLKFREGKPPAGYKKKSESFLFNTEVHRRIQSVSGWISFHLIEEARSEILASIHFHITNSLAVSPFKAPFGSIECSPELQPEYLYRFIQSAETALRKKGVKKIIIRQPPQCYQPGLTAVMEALFVNSGYRVRNAEINTSVKIDDADFERHIDSWELRKLKQARKAKLEFRELKIGSLYDVYSFISSCRHERKQELSMTFDALRETISRCGDRFFLFGVFKDDDIVAASIAIGVHRKILYNFYSAHPKKMDAVSPVVMLLEGMYSWCKKQDVELLDLGTSASGDMPNFSLLDFKMHLGGSPSIRYTYEKEIDK